MAAGNRVLRRRAATQRPTQNGKRTGGFTLIEVTLAMSVLLVALMAASASTIRMHSLRRQNRERTVAQNAIRTISEEIRSIAQLSIGDPGGWSNKVIAALRAGGTLGPSFNVPELAPQDGQATIGTIAVVTNETLTDQELGFELGMPRDLDGDGLVTNNDVQNAARLLPIIVRARWKGASGDVVIAHPFYVIGY